MNVDEVKSLMRSGDVAGAEGAVKELLAAEPDNAEAQMLYGTCHHLLGDDKTFDEIHAALSPRMETERNGKTLSLWRRYHKLWLILIAGGLVLATGGVLYFAEDAAQLFGETNVAADNAAVGKDGPFACIRNLYAGPPDKGDMCSGGASDTYGRAAIEARRKAEEEARRRAKARR